MTAKQLAKIFVIFFMINFVLVYLANRFFPSNVVLGTYFHSVNMALIYSSVALTLLVAGILSGVNCLLEQLKSDFFQGRILVMLFLANSVSVWLVGRMAQYLGMGISSWFVAVVLGLVLALVQKMTLRQVLK